ncbi:hypothetical protein TNCV_4003851 [Trichonephila clavipes]|nr:hypothetical protein TNCV_4003851 [Trichonephila clavipes]
MDGLQFTKNAVTVDIHSSAASSHRAQETHEAVRSDPLRRLQQSGSRVASYRIANSAKTSERGRWIWRDIVGCDFSLELNCQYLDKVACSF